MTTYKPRSRVVVMNGQNVRRKHRRYVAYYRVSTARQGQSGLGLEAQEAAVRAYLEGGKHELLDTFTEVESGKGSNALDKRPVLRDAIAHAKKKRAVLIIAKLDRLARNVHFITGLIETGVEFVAADLPFADKFMLQIQAVFAEHERDQISRRTKEALARAKARGVKLGNPNLQPDNEKRGKQAKEFARRLGPTLQALRQQGLSQRAIVAELNNLRVAAPRGGRWSLVQVQRVLNRLVE